MNKPSNLSVTDLFCGAGGSSLGMYAAGADVILALNHWKLAVDSHNANFPDTDHDCVDVSATDPRRYRSTNILWASPECTNHSISKGRKRKSQAQLELFGRVIDDPAEERSRATMFDVPRFAEYHDYDVVVVENVVDVRHWRLWDAWLHAMHLLGYDHREVYFNSMFAHLDPATVRGTADFAPQSRDRIYVVFWKRGDKAPDLEFRPVAWCGKCVADVESVQSWKNGRRWGRYRQQYVYRCPRCAVEVVPYHFAAWNAIDWSLPAERIGDRKRPLKERTMARIRKGLEKYGGTWLVLDLAYGDGDRARPMLAPFPTQTGRQTHGMVTPQLVSVNYYDDRTIPITEASGTQTTQNKFGLLMPQIVTLRGTVGGMQPPQGVDEALGTISAGGIHHGLLLPMVMALGGRQNADEPRAVSAALPTQTGTETFGVITPFLTSYYGTGGERGAAEEPLATLTALDKHALVMPMPFLAMNYSPGYTRPATEPTGTITADDHHSVVVPHPFFIGYVNGDGPPHSMTEPLLTLHTENNAGLVFPLSPPVVEECGFRMLQPHEVKAGMGFTRDYRLLGAKRDQVRMAGNAVTPPVAKMLMRRILSTFE